MLMWGRARKDTLLWLEKFI